ncbi:MAG: hypothetical protein WC781_02815 [Candidatus Pacearchaeota archaeon]
MKNSKQIWAIVGITIVVTIAITLITAGITGNVIRVFTYGQGYQQVYTKAEVDAKLTTLSYKATYSGIGEMFGDAKTTGKIWLGITQRDNKPIKITNGHTECGTNKECLIGFGGIVFPNTKYFDYDNEGIISCDQTLDLTQMQSQSGWVKDSKVIVQYLCIDKELLQYADAGFPK